MIEFDVDMGYLLESGELGQVVLHDENGEYEDVVFAPKKDREPKVTEPFRGSLSGTKETQS